MYLICNVQCFCTVFYYFCFIQYILFANLREDANLISMYLYNDNKWILIYSMIYRSFSRHLHPNWPTIVNCLHTSSYRSDSTHHIKLKRWAQQCNVRSNLCGTDLRKVFTLTTGELKDQNCSVCSLNGRGICSLPCQSQGY